MEERRLQKKIDSDRLKLQEQKELAAAEAYNPWGQPGAGAPPAARRASYGKAQQAPAATQHQTVSVSHEEFGIGAVPGTEQGREPVLENSLATTRSHATETVALLSQGSTMHMTTEEREGLKMAARLEQQAHLRQQVEERKAARRRKEEEEREQELKDEQRIVRVRYSLLLPPFYPPFRLAMYDYLLSDKVSSMLAPLIACDLIWLMSAPVMLTCNTNPSQEQEQLRQKHAREVEDQKAKEEAKQASIIALKLAMESAREEADARKRAKRQHHIESGTGGEVPAPPSDLPHKPHPPAGLAPVSRVPRPVGPARLAVGDVPLQPVPPQGMLPVHRRPVLPPSATDSKDATITPSPAIPTWPVSAEEPARMRDSLSTQITVHSSAPPRLVDAGSGEEEAFGVPEENSCSVKRIGASAPKPEQKLAATQGTGRTRNNRSKRVLVPLTSRGGSLTTKAAPRQLEAATTAATTAAIAATVTKAGEQKNGASQTMRQALQKNSATRPTNEDLGTVEKESLLRHANGNGRRSMNLHHDPHIDYPLRHPDDGYTRRHYDDDYSRRHRHPGDAYSDRDSASHEYESFNYLSNEAAQDVNGPAHSTYAATVKGLRSTAWPTTTPSAVNDQIKAQLLSQLGTLKLSLRKRQDELKGDVALGERHLDTQQHVFTANEISRMKAGETWRR